MKLEAWQRFVLQHGWKAWKHELAAVLGRSEPEVLRVRDTGACSRPRNGKIKRFAELFALWHGRAPRDEEWPRPRKNGGKGTYEWHAPELALLASLVGRMSSEEIAGILTERLRKVTGDRRARRTRISVLIAQNHQLGLVTTDVIGGLTIAQAGRDAGSRAVIYQAIRLKQLRPFRVGRLWVIPREAWEAWKKSRVFPPKGYVQLSSIRKALSIHSDKLPEFAKKGLIPTAVRCNPYGFNIHSTKFGTWFVDPKVARKLVADRRAGRPMPWHGQPDAGNLKVTWRRLQARRHPTSCATCGEIWGSKGAPTSYADYLVRYPPLALGAKRHLTKVWSPGLTRAEVARHCGVGVSRVIRAVENGVLLATRRGRRLYVSRTHATQWRERKCPSGDGDHSWISLANAAKQYLFTLRELRAFIRAGKLRSQVGEFGAQRGVVYVPRHQVGELRRSIGFSEEEAARRVGVSIERLRVLLKGCQWRDAAGIPLATVRSMQQRYESEHGYTIEQAAEKLRVPVAWVEDRIVDGTIRILRNKWDRRRRYVSGPMYQRLLEFRRHPQKRERMNSEWLPQGAAATDAGVSNGTIIKWAVAGDIRRRRSRLGWRYHRRSVRARARRYWRRPKFLRAVPPSWLRPHPSQLQQKGFTE